MFPHVLSSTAHYDEDEELLNDFRNQINNTLLSQSFLLPKKIKYKLMILETFPFFIFP